MAVIIVLLLFVAGLYVYWLLGPNLGPALEVVRRSPHLLLAAVAVVFGQIAIEALPPSLAAPLFTTNLGILNLGLSIPFIAWFAVEVGVRTWLVRAILEARGRKVAPTFLDHAVSLFALSVVMWVAVLGSIVLTGMVAAGLGVVAFLGWALFVYWLSTRAAPILAALALDPSPRGAVGRGAALLGARASGWRLTVLVELLVLGALTFVYYWEGSRSDLSIAMHGTVVAELTTRNAWPDAIASALKDRVPVAIFYGSRIFTAFASTLFIVSYVVLGTEGLSDAG